jgi:hypothetical protein
LSIYRAREEYVRLTRTRSLLTRTRSLLTHTRSLLTRTRSLLTVILSNFTVKGCPTAATGSGRALGALRSTFVCVCVCVRVSE